MTNGPSQVDQGAAEAGVEGAAGRPLPPCLRPLQAARRPPPGYHGGNHLEEAGRELADLPFRSATGKKILLETERRNRESSDNFKNCQILPQPFSILRH